MTTKKVIKDNNSLAKGGIQLVVGIMGYSGSGKSTLTNEFEKLGAFVIDADKIGKDILKVGSDGLKKVVELFGEDILLSDKSLNRKKLGEIVFSDEEKLNLLNSVTWNAINEEIKKRVNENKDKVVIIDCALLYKITAYNLCNQVIFLNIPEEILIERIVKRDNISYDTAKNRLERQKDSEFIKKATIVLDNETIDGLKAKAKELMKGWSE